MNQQNDNYMIEKIEISTDHGTNESKKSEKLNDQHDREDHEINNIWATKRSRKHFKSGGLAAKSHWDAASLAKRYFPGNKECILVCYMYCTLNLIKIKLLRGFMVIHHIRSPIVCIALSLRPMLIFNRSFGLSIPDVVSLLDIVT